MMLWLVSMTLPAAAPASAIGHWQGMIDQAAARFDVPSDWVAQVMKEESGGNTLRHGRPIRSAKGAMGLMQIMPATWQMLRDAYQLGTDPDNPTNNIDAGAAYLSALYAHFGYPGLFAAYHAGPSRYQLFLSGKTDLPSATLTYTRHILTGLGSAISSGRDIRDFGSREAKPGLFIPLAVSPRETEATPGERPAVGVCAQTSDLWAAPPSCDERLEPSSG
jgi:hypothetical protein